MRRHARGYPYPCGCLAIFLLLLALHARAGEPWSGDWVEVRTPNFTLISAISARRTVKLAQELEHFRSAAEIVTNIGEFEERVPTRIYVLDRREKEFGLKPDWGGYFRPGLRANHAVLISSGTHTSAIMRHEYVHFLVHNRDQRIYPAWFSEGFAEFMATLKVLDGKRIIRGDVPRNRAEWLERGNWMRFDRLLAIRSAHDLGLTTGAMFYAQSWFLVHYLMRGRENTDFGAQMGEYLQLLESGQDPVAAFGPAFDLDPQRLQGQLLRYSKRLRADVLTLSDALPPVAATTRTMAVDEVATALGWLVFHMSGHRAAQRYFAAAEAANPSNSRALAGLGDVLKFDGEHEAARPWYERALELDPGNAENQLDFAEYWLDLAEREQDAERRREFLVAARRHFARSQRIAPDLPEIYAMNALSYLMPGEDAGKAVISLEHARDLLPSSLEIRALLTDAYIATHQLALARAELRRLIAWAHPEQVPEMQELMQRLDESQQDARAPGPS